MVNHQVRSLGIEGWVSRRTKDKGRRVVVAPAVEVGSAVVQYKPQQSGAHAEGLRRFEAEGSVEQRTVVGFGCRKPSGQGHPVVRKQDVIDAGQVFAFKAGQIVPICHKIVVVGVTDLLLNVHHHLSVARLRRQVGQVVVSALHEDGSPLRHVILYPARRLHTAVRHPVDGGKRCGIDRSVAADNRCGPQSKRPDVSAGVLYAGEAHVRGKHGEPGAHDDEVANGLVEKTPEDEEIGQCRAGQDEAFGLAPVQRVQASEYRSRFQGPAQTAREDMGQVIEIGWRLNQVNRSSLDTVRRYQVHAEVVKNAAGKLGEKVVLKAEHRRWGEQRIGCHNDGGGRPDAAVCDNRPERV